MTIYIGVWGVVTKWRARCRTIYLALAGEKFSFLIERGFVDFNLIIRFFLNFPRDNHIFKILTAPKMS